MVKMSVGVLPPRTMLVGLKALDSCGVESVTTTSSSAAPHALPDVPVKVSVVVLPVLGTSAVPSDLEAQPGLVEFVFVASNEKLPLVDPNCTDMVSTVGAPKQT